MTQAGSSAAKPRINGRSSPAIGGQPGLVRRW
jgi:hypothetical protein